MKSFISAVLFAAAAATWAHAQTVKTATLCVGEKLEECEKRYGRGSFGAAPGCTGGQNFITRTCTLQGSGTRVDYHTVSRVTQGGNRCGYTLVDIYCHWDSPIKN